MCMNEHLYFYINVLHVLNTHTHIWCRITSGRITWVQVVQSDWLTQKTPVYQVVFVAGRCTPLDYVTSYPKKTLLLSLYCSVMHLFSKQFLGRYLRVYLSPGWKLLAGNIWSTIRCMYFCDQRNIYYQKYTFFQRKPTLVFGCMRSSMYVLHTHVFECIRTDCHDRPWCCGLWHLLPRGNLCYGYFCVCVSRVCREGSCVCREGSCVWCSFTRTQEYEYMHAR